MANLRKILFLSVFFVLGFFTTHFFLSEYLASQGDVLGEEFSKGNGEVFYDEKSFILKVDKPNEFQKKLKDKAEIKELGQDTYKIKVKSKSEMAALITTARKYGKVSPNYKYRAKMTTNDYYFPNQWGVTKIQGDQGWDITKGNESLIIAVIDTGINYNHEDLSNKIARRGDNSILGYDFVYDDSDPMPNPGGGDAVWHGTYVAGIVAASTNNAVGVSGTCWNCKIMPLKGLDEDGSGTTDTIAAAIRYAADNGAKVINMSLGYSYFYGEDATLRAAIDYAYERDVIMVAASGNDSEDQVNYPAAFDKVIAVGATRSDDTRADFSNFGDKLDVVAPGVNVLSAYSGWSSGVYTNNQYTYGSGTSAAAPFVAGQIGLVVSSENLENSSLKNRLILSTDKVSAMNGFNFSNYYGFGRANVKSSLVPSLNQMIRGTSSIYFSEWPLQAGKTIDGWVNIKNNSGIEINLGSAVIARHEDGTSYGFERKNANCDVLGPEEECLLEVSANFPKTGNYYMYIYGNVAGNPFVIGPQSNEFTSGWVAVAPPRVNTVSAVYFSPWPPVAGQEVTAWVDIKNNGSVAISGATFRLAARFEGWGSQPTYFTPTNNCASILAGATCRLEGTATLSGTGNYLYYVYSNVGGYPFFMTNSGGSTTSGWFPVGAPNLQAVSPVYFSPWPPLISQETTAFVDIKNNGPIQLNGLTLLIAARPNGWSGGPIYFTPTTACPAISSGATCRLQGKATLTQSGNHLYYVYANLNGYAFFLNGSSGQMLTGWLAAQ